ncbi:MAG: S-layer homology domain-containing protein [Phormidesmis sp.]
MSVLYVSPTGQDSDEGSANFPYKTVSHALQQARPGSVVQLASGTYQAGERFPLVVPAGVTLAGTNAQAVIQGGSTFSEGLQNSQLEAVNVAVVLRDRAQIREVTITNPNGSGVLTFDGAALVVNNRLLNCQQHGVLAAGTAHPFISKNVLENGTTGLTMVDKAKGEARQNQFERTGYGISLAGQSAPLLVANQLVDNHVAVMVADYARPVLRQNQAIRSTATGLWVKDRAQPDIGQPQDLGGNQFKGLVKDGVYDVRNDAIAPLATAGNRFNPMLVQGQVDYLPSQIPDEAAIPTVLLGQVEPAPLPPLPPSSNQDPSAAISLDSRFDDLVGHWSAPFVEALAEQGLVKGFLDGTFQPDSQVTRAQFAALIAAAFPEADGIREVRRFPDVPAGFWAARAIRQAQTRGFISGFPDGSFRPNAPLTRVQAIVALVNGLGLGDGRSESLLIYSDRAQIPSYAIEPVAAATEHGLVVSYPDPYALRPLEPITRAETTTLVHQALVNANKTTRIDSPFIPEPDSASPNFIDLSSRHWATNFIEPLVQKGWLSGFSDGSFQPDAPMTRAQFAALLVGAFNPEPKRLAVRFRDVPNDFWAATVIQKAYQAQFLSGFPDLTFDPNYPLTKLQALLALVSGLALQSTSPPGVNLLLRYSDRAAIPQYATNTVAIATQLGLVFNHPTVSELRPNRAATRAEVSAMVYQALAITNELPPVASRYQVLVD